MLVSVCAVCCYRQGFDHRQRYFTNHVRTRLPRYIVAEFLHDPSNGVVMDVKNCGAGEAYRDTYVPHHVSMARLYVLLRDENSWLAIPSHRERMLKNSTKRTRRWGTYESLMMNAKFCFAPGQLHCHGHPHSFRLQEALFTCACAHVRLIHPPHEYRWRWPVLVPLAGGTVHVCAGAPDTPIHTCAHTRTRTHTHRHTHANSSTHTHRRTHTRM